MLLSALLFALSFAAEPMSPVPDGARLVTLGGAITETVCALGRCDDIVAADASSTAPEAVRDRAMLGFHRRINAEGVLSMQPQVVLATDDSGPPEVLAQIEAAGVRVVRVSGEASAKGAAERIRALGALLDATAKAEALATGLSDRLEAVRARVGDAPTPRVLFIYARGGGTMMVAGRDTAATELIVLSGGLNAVDAYEGYKPLTAEAVVMARPDTVLLTQGGLKVMGGEDGVWAAPGLTQTPAYRDRRVIAVDDLLLLGFGPRLPDAVRAVAAGLHPERFQ